MNPGAPSRNLRYVRGPCQKGLLFAAGHTLSGFGETKRIVNNLLTVQPPGDSEQALMR